MSKTVLIAGGSGLLGDALSEKLIELGYEVRILGRGKEVKDKIKHFTWDPAKSEIDPQALKDVDYVINLAGANVGQGRWTQDRKKLLLSSRVDSTQLLAKTIIENKIPIKKFIQASAIGYYGFEDSSDHIETDLPGKDFLAVLTQQWENSTIDITNAKIPLAVLRIGVVLSPKGGALIEMTKPIKLFAGNYLGSGKQMIPWIHIDDMVAILLKSIRDTNFVGTYNCTAPEPATNKMLTQQIAKSIKRPAWPFGVPSFVLKLLLGEQAQIVLEGYHISNKKLLNSGFIFQYPILDKAIKNLFAGNSHP